MIGQEECVERQRRPAFQQFLQPYSEAAPQVLVVLGISWDQPHDPAGLLLLIFVVARQGRG